MSSIQLLFTATNGALSWAIRACTWSTWSHVGLVAGAIQCADRHELVTIPARDPARIITAAAGQIGKPYDYEAIVGLSLHRDWQQADAWFCSELAAWAFHEAGEPLFRADCVRRVTPQHLWMLAPLNSSAAGDALL
ncbi:hypothetical protein [Ralstonia solanacearum]|uniref:hypothetical protein n=1 Tax=Ralstonia solanacearum TaxID=305 RepID=UPI002306BEA8|nr:hypothetical protein [Ralstonia solanacearum]MDB0511336.1 hypothetical protein [Ralstonia solanacearum]